MYSLSAIAHQSIGWLLLTGLLLLTGCNSAPTSPPATTAASPSPSPLPPVPSPIPISPNSVPRSTPTATPESSAAPSPAPTNSPAESDAKVGTIKFQPGATTATVEGTVASKQIARYTFDASAGQPATIAIASPNQDVLLTLIDPQGNPIQRYQSGGSSWSGKLTRSGTYTIDAFAAGQTSTFSIKVEIQPKP